MAWRSGAAFRVLLVSTRNSTVAAFAERLLRPNLADTGIEAWAIRVTSAGLVDEHGAFQSALDFVLQSRVVDARRIALEHDGHVHRVARLSCSRGLGRDVGRARAPPGRHVGVSDVRRQRESESDGDGLGAQHRLAGRWREQLLTAARTAEHIPQFHQP